METYKQKGMKCRICGKNTRVWDQSLAYEHKLCGTTPKCDEALHDAIREAAKEDGGFVVVKA